MRFKNKVALITGGAAGIGEATTRRFAEEGASVVVFDVDGKKLDKVLADIRRKGGEGIGIRCDVADIDSVDIRIDEVVEKLGSIDILFNNAGIGCRKVIEDITQEDFDRVMTVNIKSMFFISKKIIGFMKKKGTGRIINNASVNAFLSAHFTTVYAASKGAVVAFTKSLAGECSSSGITVNAIAPGGTVTPAANRLCKSLCPNNPDDGKKLTALDHPMRRLASPQEIAGVVAFLASDDASFITATVLHVDGGVTGIWNTISQNRQEMLSVLKTVLNSNS